MTDAQASDLGSRVIVPGYKTLGRVASAGPHSNWVGIATIGIRLLEGVIHQDCFENVEERARMSKLFDLSTFALLAVLYLAINITVALAASH